MTRIFSKFIHMTRHLTILYYDFVSSPRHIINTCPFDEHMRYIPNHIFFPRVIFNIKVQKPQKEKVTPEPSAKLYSCFFDYILIPVQYCYEILLRYCNPKPAIRLSRHNADMSCMNFVALISIN